eukprot:6186212-Amphidinium_carterae.3
MNCGWGHRLTCPKKSLRLQQSLLIAALGFSRRKDACRSSVTTRQEARCIPSTHWTACTPWVGHGGRRTGSKAL